MYTIILDEGVVLDTNGVQVAPCQSIDDVTFIAYSDWIKAGNIPIILETRV
jgi:hypothetical protein